MGIVQEFYRNQFVNFIGVIGISLISLENVRLRKLSISQEQHRIGNFSAFQRGPRSFRKGNAEASTLLLGSSCDGLTIRVQNHVPDF